MGGIAMKKVVAALVALVLLAGAAGAETYLLADIGEDAEIVDSSYAGEGAYWEEYRIDGVISVMLGRDRGDPAREGTRVEFGPVGSYPAERYESATGANEDARTVHTVYIFTDDWTYCAGISVPADLEADYAEEIERIIASLSIEDDAELESQPYPFDLSDVESYLLLPFETETDTLAELSAMLGANRFTWTESDAAGMLRLTLSSDFGSVEVDVENVGDLLSGDIIGSADLPEELLNAQNAYAFRAAHWSDGGYPLPCVRDISVGMRMQDAIDAFAGGEIEWIAGEPGFSQCITYAVQYAPEEEDELWESAELRLYGNDGIIERIALMYDNTADLYESGSPAEYVALG
jgi:hypothetical protein